MGDLPAVAGGGGASFPFPFQVLAGALVGLDGFAACGGLGLFGAGGVEDLDASVCVVGVATVLLVFVVKLVRVVRRLLDLPDREVGAGLLPDDEEGAFVGHFVLLVARGGGRGRRGVATPSRYINNSANW